MGTRSVFGGESNAYLQTVVDLSNFEGLSTFVRFRFVSDPVGSVDGWYIDDIGFGTEFSIRNKIYVLSSQGHTISALQDSLTTIKNQGSSLHASEMLDHTVQIYPNPTKNELTVQWIEAISGPSTLRLYSITGQLLQELRLVQVRQGEKTGLSLKAYPVGTYILEISAKEGIHRYKVLKE